MHGITEIGTTFTYTSDSLYYYNDKGGHKFPVGESFEIPTMRLSSSTVP